MQRVEIQIDNAAIQNAFKDVDLNTFMPDGGSAVRAGEVTLPRHIIIPLANLELFGWDDSNYMFSHSIGAHYYTFILDNKYVKQLNRAFLKGGMQMINFVWLDVMPEEVSPVSGERFRPIRVMIKG